MGSATFDSPEKAGPTTATVWSLMTFWASCGACAGSPWLSYSARVTLGPPPLALYCWTASLTPLLMLIPSCGELLPVRAPKYPIFTAPPLLPEPVVELEPHAAATRARTAAVTNSPQRARLGGPMAILLDVMIQR